jgi:PAS domain S-box-containing protein
MVSPDLTRPPTNYGKEDGVLSREFNPAGCQLKDGRIYFGGIKGITYFDPLNIADNEQISNIEFTRLTILNEEIEIGKFYNGRVVLERSLNMRPEIVLKPNDIIFTIEYANLDYSYLESEQFAYLLEGFDTEWRQIGNRRNVSFTNLPPGKYTLKVKVGNADGIWGTKTADLPIRVLPAFYETWWFISLSILFILGGFGLIYKLRTNFLLAQGRRLEEHNQQLNAEILSRREAHRIARERAEYFKAVISQSPVPMAIHSLDGRITHLNQGWLKLWGKPNTESMLANYQVETDEMAQKLGLSESFSLALAGNIVEKSELNYSDHQGENKIVQLLLYPLRNESGVTSQIMISIEDITEVITHRNTIERSLKEKSLLLKEVHHRVKNNLQIIASLLGLQKAGIKEEGIQHVLEEFRGRVNSMALVHDALYRSPDFDEIDVSVYLPNLISSLQQAFDQDRRPIGIQTHISSITLPVDIAVPCGLVINEIVTNALKYAFTETDREDKQISIEFSELGGGWLRLRISDNGIGFQHKLEWDSIESLGLYLVKIISEQQLMGKVEAGNDGGAWIQIDFPLNPDFD